MNNSKELRKYCRAIERQLYCNKDLKKQFLQSMHSSIETFLEENPTATMLDIYTSYGTAEEIVDAFYEDNPESAVVRKKTKVISSTIAVFLAVAICFGLFIGGLFIFKEINEHREIPKIEIPVENN